jgi:hypothetical protein
MSDLVVRPLDERAYALLAEEGLGPDLFNPTQHVACELVEAYATELALDLCRQLGLEELLATRRTVAEVRSARYWGQEITAALQWLLDRLAQTGYLVHATGGYRLDAPLPPSQREAIRARGLATDASYAPAYELLDEAAAAFPAVAHGQTTGERALLGKATLWIRYFDNRNAYYALNNRVTAAAVAGRLTQGAHVLEVGAGLGSATEALLEALTARTPSTASRPTVSPNPCRSSAAERSEPSPRSIRVSRSGSRRSTSINHGRRRAWSATASIWSGVSTSSTSPVISTRCCAKRMRYWHAVGGS